MTWQALLYCPGRRSDVSQYAHRLMHDNAQTEADQKEYYDVLEYDHEPSRHELELDRAASKCPGCGDPYANVHEGVLVA